jgi:hypothetical protein
MVVRFFHSVSGYSCCSRRPIVPTSARPTAIDTPGASRAMARNQCCLRVISGFASASVKSSGTQRSSSPWTVNPRGMMPRTVVGRLSIVIVRPTIDGSAPSSRSQSR